MIQLERKTVSDFDDTFVYEDFLNTQMHGMIKQYLLGVKNNPRVNFEGREMNVNDKSYKLLGTKFYRPYVKLWDISYQKSYWEQTHETMVAWANNQYKNYISPVVRLLIDKINQVEPIKNKTYIPIRGICNILKPDITLDPHLDGEGFLADTYKTTVRSATYYADVDDSEGGEYWDERGLLHKPKNNSVLINAGNHWTHGVTRCSKERVGITIRFYALEDLILPGSVDQLLYKPTL